MVIIPHSTQLNLLAVYSQKIIKLLNSKDFFIYRKQPLWIDFDAPSNINELAKQIVKVCILEPELVDFTLSCKVLIKTNSGELFGKLTLCNFKADSKVDCDSARLEKTLSKENSIFPMELKVFRLANDVRISGFSVAVQEEKWVRI